MNEKPEIYAVVMAGGRGERFWPQSRQNCPKQLLRLIGNLTLIEQTTGRMLNVTSPEHCLVVTNDDYVEPMRSLLPMLPPENIIGEPVGRDTGGCLALAAGILDARGVGDDAVVIATPADHNINDIPGLSRTLNQSVQVAEACDAPVLIGVKPEFASTGYGYIHCGKQLEFGDGPVRFFEADGFREKPMSEDAEAMFEDVFWRWNSGIFIWTHGVFKRELGKYAPELFEVTRRVGKLKNAAAVAQYLRAGFAQAPNISIDYALLEKMTRLVVAECSFDWADIGSWSALRRQIRPEEHNNVVRGLFAGLDTENCIIVGDSQRLIATIDVRDLIIVSQDDVTLVCHEQSAQRVKELVKKLDADPGLRKFL